MWYHRKSEKKGGTAHAYSRASAHGGPPPAAGAALLPAAGLVWQGLTHDLSKYSPTEFWRSAKYYQGYRSPNDQERLENGVSCRGCIIRVATVITLSTGSTTACGRTAAYIWAGVKCPSAMWRRCSATASLPAGCTKGKNIPMHRPMTITRAPRGTFSSTRRQRPAGPVAAAAEEAGRGCGLPADPPGAEGPGVLSCGASQAAIPASCTGNVALAASTETPKAICSRRQRAAPAHKKLP